MASPNSAKRSQERASMKAPQIIRSTSRCGSLLATRRRSALGISTRRQALRHDFHAADELGDLLVVAQLFARQPRHLIGQLQIFRIGEHQCEGRRCGLLFAIRVIDQQHIGQRAGACQPNSQASARAATGARTPRRPGSCRSFSAPRWRSATRRRIESGSPGALASRRRSTRFVLCKLRCDFR